MLNQAADYRAMLTQRRRELQAALARIRSERQDDAGPDVDDIGDRASRVFNHHSLLQENDKDRAMLARVEGALERLDNGRFGVCAACGGDIEPKRLAAVPWSEFCRACQEQKDRELL